MNATVLVTGGAGYVGAHVCKALSENGYQPVTVDDLSQGQARAVQWGPLAVGDIGDRDFLDGVFAEWKPRAVLHFVARSSSIRDSVDNPADHYRVNVSGSLVLLETMLRHGVNHLVFSSTCAVYGPPERLPITEDEALNPISPYGASKAMVERMLRDFDRAYGLRSISLRYFNAAGADADAKIGEAHDPETHLIPLALQAADGHRTALEIFGDDYPTPDGTCVRDYIHVADLSAAHLCALKGLQDGIATTAFNVGAGRGVSVAEVVRAVERVTGRKVPVKIMPRRPGDASVLVADAGRIGRVLGWAPKHTDMDSIVRTAWRWHARYRPGSRSPEDVQAAGE